MRNMWLWFCVPQSVIHMKESWVITKLKYQFLFTFLVIDLLSVFLWKFFIFITFGSSFFHDLQDALIDFKKANWPQKSRSNWFNDRKKTTTEIFIHEFFFYKKFIHNVLSSLLHESTQDGDGMNSYLKHMQIKKTVINRKTTHSKHLNHNRNFIQMNFVK